MKANLKYIMKRAWEIKKMNKENIFGLCLKMAWEEAKKIKKSFTGFAKVLKEKEAKLGLPICQYLDSDFFTFKKWEKGNYSRIYCNDYKGRSVGYINAFTREIEYSYNQEAFSEMENFLINFEF